MAELVLESVAPWAPHVKAAPLTERNNDTLAVAANGTRTCVGGWQLTYSGVEAGKSYVIEAEAKYRDVNRVRDVLRCEAFFGDLELNASRRRVKDVKAWDFLLPEWDDSSVHFSRCLMAPEDTEQLIVRYTFRWSAVGSAEWQLPEIMIREIEDEPTSVSVCVVTGQLGDRKRIFASIQDNVDFYLPLCRDACEKEKPDLIVLPEIALQYGMKDSAIDSAVPAQSKETEPFANLAREYGIHVLLGMWERDEDAVHNSAVLFGPTGAVEGVYRKVHLAVGGEMDSGVLPGDDFPVFDTQIGRVGCNICMDSSAVESSRMIGLNGADFLLLPIMGDHRAQFPDGGGWDPDRFRAIMQTRAMDNQVCMVVAVNTAKGSCVIDRTGEVLVWNDGSVPYVRATIELEDGIRAVSGGCLRGVNWMQRRPHAYGAFGDEENVGGLLVREY
ncbi:MAG: carbon-nitrogen hydrolase family protein [Candidatus Latescibacteria bacterium]|jgi:predicted amidohydrolase|nr:carbon-nitrogen hydrolase family protein [Candidatus Latescibacterota bacterium]MBT5830966.1 carbon-nitrogen hydrolase family protein [Candidatus Latescibacterota bacterium]